MRGAFVQGVQSAALNGRAAWQRQNHAARGDRVCDFGRTILHMATWRNTSSSRKAPFEQDAPWAFEHILAFMGDKLRDEAPVESLGHLPASPDRGYALTGSSSALHRFRSAPGSRARAGACALQHDCLHNGRRATAEAMVAALRTAGQGKQPSNVCKVIGRKSDTLASRCPQSLRLTKMLNGGGDYAVMPCGAAGRSESFSHRRLWAQGKPLACRHRRTCSPRSSARRNTHGVDPSLLASFEALMAQPGNVADVEVSALLWLRPRGLGIEGEARGRAGACTWGSRALVRMLSQSRRRCILAGNWPVGSSGGVPV